MSRIEKSIKNIKFGLIFQLSGLLVSFFTRKVFVLVLTQEYLGLNGTFSSILSMLSLAELGIGSAITFSLYKPLAEQDEGQIAAVMSLFRRAYRAIGIAVALLGCAIANDYPGYAGYPPHLFHLFSVCSECVSVLFLCL